MNWMRYRPLYLLISSVVILSGLFGLFKWGLILGVDFKGGSILEYSVDKNFSTRDATDKIKAQGIGISTIQKSGNNNYLLKLAPLTGDQKDKIKSELEKLSSGKVEELRFETVGPSIGPDLVKKTLYAMLIAAVSILLWVAIQFKSFKFGTSAVLAMLHDSLVVIGTYSLFGHFFGAEVDFLFVTALLTILSFSVHDTIIVYDRIRETHKKIGGDVGQIANKALSETMVRSFNNSVTLMFMLLALVLMGGTTIRWFAVALLVGTISGTYSSPFVAVPILVTWDEVVEKLRKRRSK